jgi:hypothetical protein
MANEQIKSDESLPVPNIYFGLIVLFWYIPLFPLSYSIIVTWFGSFIIFIAGVSTFRHQYLAKQGQAQDSYVDFCSEKSVSLLLWQLKMPGITWIVLGIWTLICFLLSLI